MDIFMYHMIVGVAFNIATVADNDIRPYWFEFGLGGFVIQLFFSSLLFPIALYGYVECKTNLSQ